ncbi:hypothetical protein [Methanoculleus sp. UBA303]|uniref:hypothetical protein n=1 Tax=Methanoculleus sp. UBA303 TaxID=1915497 RepID=UPI0025FF5DC8|nr:hypothetical protein [Methanoculleus sp. UBA303]
MDLIYDVFLLILRFYPILAIGVAAFVGLWNRYHHKKEFWVSYQLATAVFTLFAIGYLSIPIVLSYQLSQDILTEFAIVSLILALAAITTSNLRDISANHNFIDLNSKIEAIQENMDRFDQTTQSIFDKVKSIDQALSESKQHQYQQVNNLTSETSASHNGDGAVAISTN